VITLEELGPIGVDELVLVVPAGVAIAALTLLGYRAKKKSSARARIESAHQPPSERSTTRNDDRL
jgi:hypothetical protein